MKMKVEVEKRREGREGEPGDARFVASLTRV
jgi:hypothetical protein